MRPGLGSGAFEISDQDGDFILDESHISELQEEVEHFKQQREKEISEFESTLKKRK